MDPWRVFACHLCEIDKRCLISPPRGPRIVGAGKVMMGDDRPARSRAAVRGPGCQEPRPARTRASHRGGMPAALECPVKAQWKGTFVRGREAQEHAHETPPTCDLARRHMPPSAKPKAPPADPRTRVGPRPCRAANRRRRMRARAPTRRPTGRRASELRPIAGGPRPRPHGGRELPSSPHAHEQHVHRRALARRLRGRRSPSPSRWCPRTP